MAQPYWDLNQSRCKSEQWFSTVLPQINSSPPGQNGRHFAEDIFRCIFMNENLCILIKISLNFVPRVDNNPALV